MTRILYYIQQEWLQQQEPTFYTKDRKIQKLSGFVDIVKIAFLLKKQQQTLIEGGGGI